MTQFTTRALSPETWPDFEALAAAHHGVWGGCWCMAFHAHAKFGSADAARAAKKDRVLRGATHAALVYDPDGACAGWAQFGPPAELPRIKNRKAYEQALDRLPDWRITCLFSGKTHRKQGVARAGVEGALRLIAEAGGGLVEAYPEDTTGRKVAAGFLWNGTTGMFETLGFTRQRQIGKYKWVMRRAVAAE